MVDTALADEPLGPGDVVLLGFEVPDAAVVAGARAAAARAPARSSTRRRRRDLPDGACDGPLLTPNGLEAAALTGETEPAAAARALARRTGAPVLVTVGADGALLVDGGECVAIAAPEVEVVDTTGAGDALNGTLAAGLAAGRDPGAAAREAVEAASASVQRPGARG